MFLRVRRDCQQGNQRGAPPLQEDEHHDDHQPNCFEQSVLNFFQTFGYRERGVKWDSVVQTLRKSGLGLCHQRAHAIGSFHSIGAGKLVDGQKGGRFSI